MKVKRYGTGLNGRIEEMECGAFTGYAEYSALLKERDALAVENAGLKSYIRDECYVTPPNSGSMAEADTAAEDYMPETPATDASIANIHAQGVDMAITVIKTMMSATAPAHHAIGMLKAQAAQLRKESNHD